MDIKDFNIITTEIEFDNNIDKYFLLSTKTKLLN